MGVGIPFPLSPDWFKMIYNAFDDSGVIDEVKETVAPVVDPVVETAGDIVGTLPKIAIGVGVGVVGISLLSLLLRR